MAEPEAERRGRTGPLRRSGARRADGESPSRAAEVRGELSALQAGVERGAPRLERITARLAAVDDEGRRGGRRGRAPPRARSPGRGRRAAPDERPAGRRGSPAAAEAGRAEAEETPRAAEAERHAGRPGPRRWPWPSTRPAPVPGPSAWPTWPACVGTLLDLVEVDEGWEAAFEAAAGDALAAVVVEASTRRPHRGPRRAPVPPTPSGAVLALGRRSHARRLPADGIRAHVRGRDPAVARCSTPPRPGSSWSTAGRAASTPRSPDPSAVFVTRDGDRFGPSGWRVGAAGHRAPPARPWRRHSAEPRRPRPLAAEPPRPHRRAGRARRQPGRPRPAPPREVHDGTAPAPAPPGRAGPGRRRGGGELAAEIEVIARDAAELDERLGRDREPAPGASSRCCPGSRPRRPALAERARAMAEARSTLDAPAAEAADAATRPRGGHQPAPGAAPVLVERRRTEVEERLSRSPATGRAAEARRLELDRRAVGHRGAWPRSSTDRLAERRGRASSTCASVAAVSPRRPAPSPPSSTGSARSGPRPSRSSSELRERLQRAELDEAETEAAPRDRGRGAAPRPRRASPTPPWPRRAPELPEGITPAARVRELERELRLMGPINPLALEEFEALQERHEFLEGQLDDVKRRRRELAKVIRAIDAEIVSVFAAAFADVGAELRAALRDAVPGRRGPAAAHRARQPARHRHRDRGQAVGQERARSSRCSRAASARSPRWRTCSPCSGPGRRPST